MLRISHSLVAALAALLVPLVAAPAVEATTAPPPNDDLSAALAVGGADGSVDITNVGAGAEPGEPVHAGRGAGQSVWLTWTPTRTGRASVSVVPSGTTGFAAGAYDGRSVDDLTELAEAASPDPDLPSVLRFDVLAGARYHLAFDGLAGTTPTTGTFEVRYRVFAPANDAFADALVLAGRAGHVGTTTFAATNEPGEPVHPSATGSVWLRWTAPADGVLALVATRQRGDSTLVQLYEGDALPGLVPVVTSTAGTASAPVTGGRDYRIALVARMPPGSAAATEDDIVLSYHLATNDDLAGATPVDAATFEAAVALDGTAEPGEPAHAGAPATASRWFRWRPGAGVPRAEVVAGAARVALYHDGEVDDLRALLPGEAIMAGAAVLVAVDSTGGSHTATVRLAVGAPVNDDPDSATTLVPGTWATGTNVGAGGAGDLAVPGGGGHAVWFRVPTPADRPIAVQAGESGGAATALAVYEERAGTPALVGADGGGVGRSSLVSFRPRPRATYLVGVDSTQGGVLGHVVVAAGGTFVSARAGAAPEGGPGRFVVSAWPPPAHPVKVRYRTVPGSAGPADFTARAGTVELRPDSPTAAVEIPLADDDLDEARETLTLLLDVPSDVTDGPVDELTILDRDLPPAVTVTVGSVGEGEGQVSAGVGLAKPSARPVRVLVGPFRPLWPGIDRPIGSGDADLAARIVLLPPGTTSAAFAVPIVDDGVDEADEELVVAASPQPAGWASIARTRIVDDDDPPTLTIADVEADEDIGGSARLVQVPVGLSEPSELDVGVDYTTADGTAVGPFDFRRATSRLTIPAGQVSSSVNVLIRPDNLDEDDEHLFFVFSAPVNVTLGVDRGRVVIVDDDDAPVLQVADASAREGDGVLRFMVALSQVSARSAPIRVSFRAEPGSAGVGDFEAVASTLEIPAGATTAVIEVPLVDDDQEEGEETVVLRLSQPFQVQVPDAEAVGSIVDDDKPSGA